jgi:hypothetical protein
MVFTSVRLLNIPSEGVKGLHAPLEGGIRVFKTNQTSLVFMVFDKIGPVLKTNRFLIKRN